MGGATVAGLALLGVVVLFVIVPLFDPALVETFAGTYPVDLEGHQKTTHEAFFKKGQEVIIKVTNHGGMEHFQVTVRDPDEKTVISRTNTLHDNAEIRFVTKQAGRYQIEISNDSGFYGRAVVKYRAN